MGRHRPVVGMAAGVPGRGGAHRRPGARPRRALRVPGARHLRPVARRARRLRGGLDRVLRRRPARWPRSLVRVAADELDLPPDDLPAWTDGQFANLVANHYLPAARAAPLPGQTRVGAHTDRGGITLLTADEAPGGLEVRPDRSGLDAGRDPRGRLRRAGRRPLLPVDQPAHPRQPPPGGEPAEGGGRRLARGWPSCTSTTRRSTRSWRRRRRASTPTTRRSSPSAPESTCSAARRRSSRARRSATR